MGGTKVNGLLNERSTNYKKAKINAKDLSEREVVEFLAANPKAMYRPLLTDGKKLVVGFEPEQIEALLKG